MHPPFTCANVRRGQPYTIDQCRLCWLYYHEEEYHRAWAGDGSHLLPAPERAVDSGSTDKEIRRQRLQRWKLLHQGGRCRHDTGPTGETVPCNRCGGPKEIALHACSLHGRCTHTQPIAEPVALCALCSDFEHSQAESC